MSLRNGFWLRLALACTSLFFFITVCSQYRQFNADSRELNAKLEQCKLNGDSLFAQLEVMYEHKRRMEVLLGEVHNSTSQEISVVASELFKMKQQAATTGKCIEDAKIQNAFEREKKKNEELHERIEMLEKKVHEMKENNEKMNQTAASSTKVQETHYAGNVSVRFDRQHSVKDNLEFNRNAQDHVPRQLIPAKELVEKIRKKNEANSQVQGRQNHLNDFDAAEDEEDELENREAPDHNEIDYKEME